MPNKPTSPSGVNNVDNDDGDQKDGLVYVTYNDVVKTYESENSHSIFESANSTSGDLQSYPHMPGEGMAKKKKRATK